MEKIISSSSKLTHLIKWKPQHNNLSLMVKSSISWEKKAIITIKSIEPRHFATDFHSQLN